uniref:Uncharacterized protein n=1 Tax=Solanum tuberosum TaxID=4113 RepID=M1DGI3_SOLTU
MANGRAKSGSPNGSAMRPILGEESCSMPSLGNYWNFGRSMDHRPIQLAIDNGLKLTKLASFPFIAPLANWRSWNPRQGGLASREFRSQLAEWSTSSIAPPCLVRTPTLLAIVQEWYCPTGSSFKLDMFPYEAWNSLLFIQPCPRASNLVNDFKALKFVNG